MGRNLKPLKNKIIVQQDTKKEKVGSLYLPQNSRELYDDFGVILAIGSDVKADVKVGDRVLFKRQPASAVENPEWENVLVLDEENVLAVVYED